MRKTSQFFNLKIIIFTGFKNRCILHRHVCVMVYFAFEDMVLVLIVTVPGHCLRLPSDSVTVNKLLKRNRLEWHIYTVLKCYN